MEIVTKSVDMPTYMQIDVGKKHNIEMYDPTMGRETARFMICGTLHLEDGFDPKTGNVKLSFQYLLNRAVESGDVNSPEVAYLFYWHKKNAISGRWTVGVNQINQSLFFI